MAAKQALVTKQKTPPQPDPAKLEAFANKAIGDLSAVALGGALSLADRFGLFNELCQHGPETAAHVAECTNTNERYVRECLNALTCGGYVVWDAKKDRYSVTPEVAAMFADEGSLTSLAPFYQQLPAIFARFYDIAEAFQNGGGVSADRFGPNFYAGQERFSRAWYNHLLVQNWLPEAGIAPVLEKGGLVFEAGPGYGTALIKTAQAFPKVRAIGHDTHAPSVEEANRRAKEAGVASRVSFRLRDGGVSPGEKADAAFVFDTLHDAADPASLLGNVRKALKPGGRLLLVEPIGLESPKGNVGPIGALVYSVSIQYCMTVGLAADGVGTGTGGLTVERLQQLAKGAGFKEVKRLSWQDPLMAAYVLTT